MWRLKSGEMVVDRHRSHIHPTVMPHLPAALARISSQGRDFLVESVDFGRPIGETICVPTGPRDEIVYAVRSGRRGLTRFVKNRAPLPTSAVRVVLKRDDAGGYFVLLTAFLGPPAPPEPWDRNTIRTRDELARAVAFWNTHALVWGYEPSIAGTETKRCPW